jgi:hypothetical protein
VLSQILALVRRPEVRTKLAKAQTAHEVIDILADAAERGKGHKVSRKAISEFITELNSVPEPSNLHLESLIFRLWDPRDTGPRQHCGGTKTCDTKRINDPNC